MQAGKKIIPYEALVDWRASLDADAFPLVATNGCFDILHPGHVSFLERARALGKTLLVGVTGDEAIRALKGSGRPAMEARDRLMLLSGLEAVSNVCLFPEVNAIGFLEKAQPDIYVKGGDYTIETINQEERRFLDASDVRIEILPRFESRSSSAILRSIAQSAAAKP
jgi:rfaE bifunctional protein nucleotidyltransferase chain/domain